MSSSSNIINSIFNTEYWKEYKEYKKLKSVLVEFFSGEDTQLQKVFIHNFDYPEDMVNPPVRFEPSTGDIYYTINFKSEELFRNAETKEKALSNSLAALDKYLPLGVTQYVEPQPAVHIPDSFTILCSLRIVTTVEPKKTFWNAIGTIFKPLSILTILGTIIGVCIKYLMN
jgi:hypothetical protein